MRRFTLIFTLAICCVTICTAQKIVVGSRISQFKPDKELVLVSGKKIVDGAMIIDFFSSKNPSCKDFYTQLERIAQKTGNNCSILVISSTLDDDFEALSKKDQDKYSFAIDHKGSVFALFAVQYLPYSVALNSQAEVVWQGNLSNLTDDIIEKIR